MVSVDRSSASEALSTIASVPRLEKLLRPGVTAVPSTAGYLDTLPGESLAPPGRAQAAWQTPLGAEVYQRVHRSLAFLLAPDMSTVGSQLHLRRGQTVADVGCGPGNITVDLADAVAPHGLAVGIDISEPMLTRAAHQARPNMGLLRGDATRLPLRDHCVDAACATAVIMLVPEPAAALRELIRVVKPGGWLLVMVPCRQDGPTAVIGRSLMDVVGRFGGARMFSPDELSVLFEELGCERIHSRPLFTMLTVRARTPMTQAPTTASAPEEGSTP